MALFFELLAFILLIGLLLLLPITYGLSKLLVRDPPDFTRLFRRRSSPPQPLFSPAQALFAHPLASPASANAIATEFFLLPHHSISLPQFDDWVLKDAPRLSLFSNFLPSITVQPDFFQRDPSKYFFRMSEPLHSSKYFIVVMTGKRYREGFSFKSDVLQSIERETFARAANTVVTSSLTTGVPVPRSILPHISDLTVPTAGSRRDGPAH
jgi:hypothetical protein